MRARLIAYPAQFRAHKLLAAPPPFFDESRVSWVQRICAAHQYPMSRLLSLLKMNPKMRDFDLNMSTKDWEELILLTEVDTRPCWRALEAVVAARMVRGEHWLYGKGGLPAYRWCSQCLLSDRIPYLRWWWRFSKASHCPHHACALQERCSWCEAPLVLGRAVMTSAGSKPAIDTLAQCQACSMPRYDPFATPCEPGATQNSSMRARSEVVRLLLDQEGSLRLTFYVDNGVTRETPINRSRTITSWNYRGQRFLRELRLASVTSFPIDKRGKVLLLNGKSFLPSRWGEGETPYVSVSRGQNRYFERSRSKLAYALRVIREEKRALAILPAGHYMRRIQEEIERETAAGR